MLVRSPTDDHLIARLNAAQVDAAAVIHNAGVLLAGVLHRGAKRRRLAIGHAQYGHGFLASDYIQRAVADRPFGQGELGHGLRGFDILGQVFQVNAGPGSVVTADVRYHGFTVGIGARRAAVTANRYARHALGVHHQACAAHAAATMQRSTVGSDCRSAPCGKAEAGVVIFLKTDGEIDIGKITRMAQIPTDRRVTGRELIVGAVIQAITEARRITVFVL